MTIEIILLALASTFRPASLVAVYALVRERSPSRLFTAYVAAGITFTLAVGFGALWLLRGTELDAGTSRTKAIVEIVAGVVTLGVAVAIAMRRIPIASGAEERVGRGAPRRLHRPTTRTAAVAGVMTHAPGIFYLLALNLIVSSQPEVPGEVVQVTIYNVVWFLLPVAVLAVCIFNPRLARTGVATLENWLRAHARAIVLVITFVAGTWLLIAGATSI